MIERAATLSGAESDGGPCGSAPWVQIKVTLLPLTFPDDDAPEGGDLRNRIVDEKTANILWIAMAAETGHATHPWLPLRIIWFAMAAFVWSIPFIASIWLNIEYIKRIIPRYSELL
jgi:hypothetical protein